MRREPGMKFLVLLHALVLLLVSADCHAQAGAARIPDSGEPTEELRTQNAMSQSEIKRISEMMDQ